MSNYNDKLIQAISIDTFETNSELDTSITELVTEQLTDYLSYKLELAKKNIDVKVQNVMPTVYHPMLLFNYSNYFHERRITEYEHNIDIILTVSRKLLDRLVLGISEFRIELEEHAKLHSYGGSIEVYEKGKNKFEIKFHIDFPPNRDDWNLFCKYISKKTIERMYYYYHEIRKG